MEGGSRLEHHSDVEALTHPSDPLTNDSYVREVDSWWSLLLPFPVVIPRSPGCRGRTNEGARITVSHETFREVVLLLLLQVLVEAVMKEAICIQTAPENSHFNCNSSYNIPDCYIDRQAQKDERWSPRGPHPPEHIVN